MGEASMCLYRQVFIPFLGGSVIFGTGHNAKIQHPKGGLQLFVSFNLKLTFCER